MRILPTGRVLLLLKGSYTMQLNAGFIKNEYSYLVQASFAKSLDADPSLLAINNSEYFVFPGFCDVHVHFREPGYFYKESIKTGSRAAAHGGYTAVCTMPNLNPVPDCKKNLDIQLSIINIESEINIYPYGAITVGERGERLSDMNAIYQKVVAFSDDGRGIQSEALMREAMLKSKSLNKIIVAHCEDNSLLARGYIHKGKYALEHGHRGICSESEWKPIERDLKLAAETGCAYHVCHISCKESVDLIRKAKKAGVDVTCETAPHYLTLDENDLKEEGRFKMNPPLRSAEDRLALVEGIRDGTIDIIATDHAPHSAGEKDKGLEGSAFGITGLETAFPVLYTKLVKENIISLEKLVELLCVNPRKRFSIPLGRDFTVWKPEEIFTVDSASFLSKGKSTPYEGISLSGKCYLTVCNGKAVYKTEELKNGKKN